MPNVLYRSPSTALTALVLWAAQAGGVPTPTYAQATAGGPQPMLYPGDRIEVSVWRNAELSGTFTVSPDSSLLHPLYGQVRVAGVPIPEAQTRIRSFLQRFESDPKFIIVPQYRVYVGGAVRDQNQHFFPEINVGQAITRAGGSTAPNRRYRVRLIRNGQHRLANLDGRQETAVLLQETIQSGDQILMEERPTFTRNVLGPALQVVQTVSSFAATYLFFRGIFDNDS